MRDQAPNAMPTQPSGPAAAAGTRSATSGGGGQITVPASLLDAAMEVDATRDLGGLGLQEALIRLHEELAPFIAGPATSALDGEVE